MGPRIADDEAVDDEEEDMKEGLARFTRSSVSHWPVWFTPLLKFPSDALGWTRFCGRHAVLASIVRMDPNAGCCLVLDEGTGPYEWTL